MSHESQSAPPPKSESTSSMDPKNPDIDPQDRLKNLNLDIRALSSQRKKENQDG